MKIDNLVKREKIEKRFKWSGNPVIGWIAEAPSFNLYYGTTLTEVTSILKDGILTEDDGFVRCTAEPNTAFVHSAMKVQSLNENKISAPWQNRAVVMITIPQQYLKGQTMYVENDEREHFSDAGLYEAWGKTDVEYYAEIDVMIPTFIPPKFIKGYMTKEHG